MAVILKFVLLGVTTDRQGCSGRSRISHWEAQPLMQVLLGENECKNKRIGSHGGGGAPSGPAPGSVNGMDKE